MEYELKYPHLEDINYPNVEQVDVFDYDYDEYPWSRWTDNVRIKLCNVPWDSDGSNAVKFDNVQSRDSWFDALEGHTVDMKSMFHEMPTQSIKVPVPFPVAMTYNYMVVDTPVMPTPENPLEYENEIRYSRTFWYVMDVQSSAPNTTELLLLQDFWTNYINDVDISYMMLRRGHAPVHKTTVDRFLADPYANREWLLAEDVNFSDDSNVNGNKFIPFGNGKKYICFASTMSLVNFETMQHAITVVGDNTAPTYSDVGYANLDKSPRPSMVLSSDNVDENRVYQDFGVSGWNWNTGHRHMNSNDVSLEYYTNAGISADVDVYAVEAEYAENFLRDMHWTYPQWFGCIVAAFDLSEDMFSKGLEITVRVYAENTSNQRTYTAWKANRTHGTIANLNLEKEDFDIPERYAVIPKLYTYPYSYIEVTEHNGRTVQFRVEDMTDDVQLRFKSSLAFPWLKYAAFFDGIGGDSDTATFVWKNVDGVSQDVHIYGNDWQKLMFEHDIPTFAVYQMAEERYNLDHSNAIEAARSKAIVDYHDTNDTANTSYWNSYWKASYQYDNEVDGATAKRDNAKDSADCLFDQSTSSRHTNTYRETFESAYLYNKFIVEGDKSNIDRALAAANAMETLRTQMANGAIGVTSTGMQSVVHGAATGAMFGAGVAAGFGMGAGAAAGAAVGLGTAIISGATTYAAMGNDAELAKHLNGNQARYFNDMYGHINYSADAATIPDSYEIAKSVYTGMPDDNKIIGRGIGHDTDALHNRIYGENELTEANAQTALALVKGGTGKITSTGGTAENSHAFTGTAIRSYNTETGIARRTRSVDRHNPNESRKSMIRGAKRDMEQARTDVLAGYLDSRHGAHRVNGVYSGDGSTDVYRWRGVQVKVRVQPEAALSMAGDQMMRFGYFVNRNWDFTGFNLMEHFTYWEVSEIWLTGGEKGVPERGQQAIKSMLRNGVTVWHNPDDIGNVTIYENWS